MRPFTLTLLVVFGLCCPPASATVLFPRLVLLPRLRCLLRLWRLRWDINDLDRYGDYYREDSEFNLVETGAFKGVDEIREYVGGGTGTSPFYQNDAAIADAKLRYQGYNRREGLCEFQVMSTSVLLSDPTTTAAEVTLKSGALGAIFFDLKKGYVVEQRAYLKHGFWLGGLGFLYNSSQTRELVCDVMENQCSPYLPEGAADNCLARLEALPLVNYDNNDTTTVRFQEESQVCRVVHAGLAALNPAGHCAHISFEPLTDPKGRIKCQTGSDKNKFEPLDLFSQSDLDAFDKYLLQQGLGDDGATVTYVE